MAGMSSARAARKQRGRPSGAVPGQSREAILTVAAELFAKHGFTGTTTRAIAAKAGVNSALVYYFFATKAKLFAAVVNLPLPPVQLKELLADGGAGRGERIIRYFLDQVYTAKNHAIAALIRSAAADPGSIPALRSSLEKSVVTAAASAIRGSDARLRAELFGSLIVGLFVVRQLVRVEPLASTSTKKVAALLGPAIDAILGDPRTAT